MTKSFKSQNFLIILGIPLLMIASMVLLTHSSYFARHSNTLSLAITLDLLLTTPFIYFLLIRKTALPKTTVIPFLIVGVITGSLILPAENQYYLSLFKTWMLPVIELFVLALVTYKLFKTIRLYKQNKQQGSFDFFTTLKRTCYDMLPKVAVVPVVTEIAVLYYGFINWKKRNLKPNEFSYHKDSGTITLLMGLILLISIETLAIHFLLATWSTLAAWILTGLSIYSGIQIFGFSKSMLKRPIVIENGVLYLRYGIMNESTISIEAIASVELSIKDLEQNNRTRKLSFLGDLEGHNVVIKLKKEHTLLGLYGIKRRYTILALHVDDKQGFKNTIDKMLPNNDA